MSRSALAAGVRYLRNVLASQGHHEDSDEQLLHAFAVGRDETAFTALVSRYGPMVEGVCRRVLGHQQDAEDAFQATLLVLAQKGAGLRKKTALASFPYGTAHRVALNAKRTAGRRRKHERAFPRGAWERGGSSDPADELSWREVRTLVDEEVARLPEKYRSAFILCCLESVSQAEAARRLGLKEGTLANRLTAARKLLAQRLARRGVELTAVLAASTLATPSAPALSPVLVSSTMDLKSSQAVTDKDGRFRVQGAGVERLALVRFRAPGLKPAPLFVINRAGFDPAAWNKAARDNVLPGNRRPDGNPPPLFGPKIEYVTPAGRRIEGTVRETGSSKPVPEYRITTLGDGFAIEAVSDKEGKYKLLGVPKKKEYVLHAHPPANSAWLLTTTDTKDAPGLQTLQVDITVARGIVVSGRVLDRATRKGVRARVHYVPLPGNKYFGKPGYDLRGSLESKTDLQEAGRYQVAVLPGPGVLMIQAQSVNSTANGGEDVNLYKQAEIDEKDRKYFKFTDVDDEDRIFATAFEDRPESLSLQNAAKVLDFAPDADPVKCDFLLDRGATRTIQIEDADGKPLKGTAVAGVAAVWPAALTIEDATCTVFALDPKKPRRLIFLHAQRNLAGTLLLRGDEKEPVVVRLGRASSMVGRLLNGDGKPLAGTVMTVILHDNPGRELYRLAQQHPKARTDKDGRFRLEGIAPAVKFYLGFMQKGQTAYVSDPRLRYKQLKPGETLDLGDLRVKAIP